MKTRWKAAALGVALLGALGCAADIGGPTGVAVEEIRCGNRACAIPNATARCNRGRCVIASCFTFRGDCNHVDADGCEVNLATDVNHCGGCGTTCAARPHMVATCASGACQYACERGYTDCDGDPANGCEVNTGADNNHCGACGNRCWGADRCCNGTCANTSYSIDHCGACGNACVSGPNAFPECSAGACALRCNWPYNNCDGDPANGCEVDLYNGNDPNNCGACGLVCRSGSCNGGMCACLPEEFRCYDYNTGRSVCVDTARDTSHCGGCNVACAPGETCSAGRCTPTCTTCGDRCVDLALDPANCGACGNACATGQFCANGLCAPLAESTGYTRTVPPADVVFVDACNGTPGLLPLTTGASTAVAMPFPFRFWGALIPEGSLFNVATDAFVNFDGTTATSIGSMPDPSTPNSLIAAFSTAQFTPLTTGPMGICTATLGAAPSRRFVVEWEHATAMFPSRITTELILNEASGAIDIIVSEPAGWGAFAGVENADGTLAVGACPDGSFYCGAFPGTYRVRFVPTL